MIKRIYDLFSGRNGPKADPPGNPANGASSVEIPSRVDPSGGIDISEENIFVRLAGLKEDDFLTQVLSVRQRLNGSLEAYEAGTSTTDQTAGIPISNDKLFESFEPVKRMRFMEQRLEEKQQSMDSTYTAGYYHHFLDRTRAMWNDRFPDQDDKEPASEEKDNGVHSHKYSILLDEQLELETRHLRAHFYTGEHQEQQAGPAGDNADALSVLAKNYDKRKEIKEKLIQQLETNIDLYSNTKNEELSRAYQLSYAHFFWSLLGMLVILALTTFFIWAFISPYRWPLLPIAFFFSWLLILTPARGFSYQLSPTPPGPLNLHPRERRKNILFLTVDICIPLSIALLIVLINRDKIILDVSTILTALGIFLLFTVIRAGTCQLLPDFKIRYKEAQEALHTKRAFDKARKQHLQALKESGLNDFSPVKETDENIKKFLEYQTLCREKYEELILKDHQKRRMLFSEKLKGYYDDEKMSFHASFTTASMAPYDGEITDISLVRKVLARLHYLYALAMGSES
jgi:uncharacterized membrane protein YqjE